MWLQIFCVSVSSLHLESCKFDWTSNRSNLVQSTKSLSKIQDYFLFRVSFLQANSNSRSQSRKPQRCVFAWSEVSRLVLRALAVPGLVLSRALVDTRRRVFPLLSRTAVSLALVLRPSRGNPCQGPTIDRSSSHLINNPPTMSTHSDSQLINDRSRASQRR